MRKQDDENIASGYLSVRILFGRVIFVFIWEIDWAAYTIMSFFFNIFDNESLWSTQVNPLLRRNNMSRRKFW